LATMVTPLVSVGAVLAEALIGVFKPAAVVG
jgi:hypothetical protein